MSAPDEDAPRVPFPDAVLARPEPGALPSDVVEQILAAVDAARFNRDRLATVAALIVRAVDAYDVVTDYVGETDVGDVWLLLRTFAGALNGAPDARAIARLDMPKLYGGAPKR